MWNISHLLLRGWIKGLKTDYRLLWRVYKNNLPLIFDFCREQNGRLFGFWIFTMESFDWIIDCRSNFLKYYNFQHHLDRVQDKRVHHLSQIVLLKKFLIPNYRGLSIQNISFFYFFGLFFKTAPRIFLLFCISVEDNKAHRWSQMLFLKIFIMPDYRGLILEKTVCLFSKTIFPIFFAWL